MKNAIIYAYTANNLGDDLFIYMLCSRYPKTRFYVYAPKKYKRILHSVPNIHIIQNEDLLQKLTHKLARHFSSVERIARKCDVAIYIGGSLFTETVHWEKDFRNVHAMQKKQQPFFIIGANFGPFEREVFYDRYEGFFRSCTDVCFRDEFSRDLFAHLRNVRQAADVVFQFPKPRAVQMKKRIVISVIYPSIRRHLIHCDDTYFTAIAAIAIHCIKNGFDILFMSFCQQEKDEDAIKEIIARIPRTYEENVAYYFYTTNIDEAVHKIAGAKAVIATRFHAMVLGWICEKAVYPIVYSPKMKTVIDDSQFTGKYSNLEQLHEVEPEGILTALLAKPTNMIAQRQNASRQFSKLDSYLE